MKTFLMLILIVVRLLLLTLWLTGVLFWAFKPETRTVETVGNMIIILGPLILSVESGRMNEEKKC